MEVQYVAGPWKDGLDSEKLPGDVEYFQKRNHWNWLQRQQFIALNFPSEKVAQGQGVEASHGTRHFFLLTEWRAPCCCDAHSNKAFLILQIYT